MRNTVRVVTAALLIVTSMVMFAGAAIAQDDEAPADGPREVIDVIQVSGLIDPIVENDLLGRLESAEETNAGDDERVLAVILQINSNGSVLDDADLLALVERLQETDVVIGAWIGPSGSQATGKAAYLVGAADFSAISEGSRIGNLGDPIDGEPEELLGAETERVRFRALGRADARSIELLDSSESTLGDFVLGMMDAGVIPDRTELVDGEGDLVQRELLVPVRFNKLSLIDQTFHTVASPAIAYLLLVAGLGLLLLEFFTAGVGIAGVTGALCLLGAGYGLGVLPFRTWALVLLVLAFFAFGIDVQTGVPRFWSGVGVVFTVVGSIFLFDEFAPSWITLGAGIIGVMLLMFTAMPNLVRTRFGTSTIGREWMLAEVGDAVTDIDPEGTVRVRDALWRARTNRATPVSAGDRIKVVHLDGPILEVEPEEGGAKDYRERRSKAAAATTEDAADN